MTLVHEVYRPRLFPKKQRGSRWHEEYWLEAWIKEFNVCSIGQYAKAIQSPIVIKKLYEIMGRDEIMGRANRDHANDVPLPITDGHPAYLRWVYAVTTPSRASQ